MAIKNWTTNYPTSQDTGTNGSDQQETVVNGDDTRASQINTVRNKLHAVAQKLGDDSDLPAGSIAAKVTALEAAPPSHNASHENGGGDEISVAGLSGLLATAQTPAAHNSSHESGGSDAIKLDDLSAPDDNTDLDATTSKHGLLPKLGGGTANFLRADGSWAAPAGGSDRTLVFSDDTEFTEAGGTLSTKKTFRIVRDSDKTVIAWRVVVSMWMDDGAGGAPGGDTGECEVTIGGDALDSTLTTTSASEVVLSGDISATLSSSEDELLTANIQIRISAGANGDSAHIKYTDIYAIYG